MSDWPIPEVSKIIRSKEAAFRMSTASAICLESAKFDCLVAKLLIYTFGAFMAFIRIRSPNNAPPVFRLDGSTEIIPTVFFGKSCINRLTNSSTKEDLPAPPVPVIPNTGTFTFSAIE